MEKKHNANRNFLLVTISIFLLVQLAVHDYQDIIHPESLSLVPIFEYVHPEDMASSGPEKLQILATLESNASGSMLLPAANPSQQALPLTFSTFSDNQQTLVIRC